MTPGLEHYLAVSVLLFTLGLFGVIARRNVLVIYMSLELMLNAANLALVAFSRYNDNLDDRSSSFSSSPSPPPKSPSAWRSSSRSIASGRRRMWKT
jgi:multisubunit Na+/H+ antiporter MnhC subunit